MNGIGVIWERTTQDTQRRIHRDYKRLGWTRCSQREFINNIRERVQRRAERDAIDPLSKSLMDRIQNQYTQRIARVLPHSNQLHLVVEMRFPLAFGSARGWYRYSRSFGDRYIEEAAVVGRDDSGWWSRRVPSRCSSLTEALEWLVPHGYSQEHRRQGDLYCQPTKIQKSLATYYCGSHTITVESDRTILTHEEHRTVELPGRRWRWAVSPRLHVGGRGGSD